MEKHYCEDCLPKLILGLAEKSISLERDPKKENIWGVGIECDRCHFQKRITYKVIFLKDEEGEEV